MTYYTAGDFARQGGYYRGYYSAGGFFKWLGGAIRSPLGHALVSLIPGGTTAAAVGEAAGGLIGGGMHGTTPVEPGAASLPGHSVQGLTSGGMMPSHQVAEEPAMGGGTPGHAAHRHAAGHRGGRGVHRRRAGARRRRGGARRRSGRRSSRRHPAGDFYAGGDVRRAESGRFLSGHRWPARRRRRGRGRGRGGAVSFTTKDGRRVSFTPRR